MALVDCPALGNSWPDNIFRDFNGTHDCNDFSLYKQECWCDFSWQIPECEETLEDGFVDYLDLAFCTYAQNESLWIHGIESWVYN